MTKRNHKNDRRRLTARERAKAFIDECAEHPMSATADYETLLTRLLEAHAAATLARHRRKVRA